MDAGVWRGRDRTVLGAGLAVGAAVVLLAWQRSGHTADGAEQLAWMEIGVAGVVAAAFSAALWIGAGRRAVCRRRVGLLGSLPTGPEAGVVTAPATDAALLATPRGGRYHRPACPLVSGRVALPAERDAHQAVGRIACEVCRP